MTRPNHLSPLFRFASLRDLLDLLAMLRDFREPLSSPEGLRRAIDLLLKAGESLGVDSALLAKLRSIADDPHVFEIALAVLRYALSFVNQASQSAIALDQSSDAIPSDVSVQSLGLAEWFALLMQLIELLRRFR
jgi:hypothetical protein